MSDFTIRQMSPGDSCGDLLFVTQKDGEVLRIIGDSSVRVAAGHTLRSALETWGAELSTTLTRLVAAERERDEARAAARWIPVGERLPLDRSSVRVWSHWDGRGFESHAQYVGGGMWVSGGIRVAGITHWQPITGPAGTEVDGV